MMEKFFKSRWFVSLILLIIASLACAIPTPPPRPGTSNVPTGLSPMSGDWNANTDFGHFAFTVDPNGNNVVTAVIGMPNWSCGGTTFFNLNMQVFDSWSISDGEFSGNVDLADHGFVNMTIDGTYDQAQKTFAGTWQEDAHGDTCSGQWEAIPRK
ncbi:MAG: hypothetical protein WCA79_13665 [Anaerolineales bacterium]